MRNPWIWMVGICCWLGSPADTTLLAQPSPACTFDQVTDASSMGSTSVLEAKLGNRLVALYVHDDRFGDPGLNTYLYDTVSGFYRQYIGDAGLSRLEISGDDSTILFTSSEALVPGGNPDGNTEVYLYDVLTDTVEQLTFTTESQPSFRNLSISTDGSRIAFTARVDLVGDNPAGERVAFVYDRGSESFQQVTDPVEDRTVSIILSGDGLHAALQLATDFATLGLFWVDLTDLTRVTVTPGMHVFGGPVMDLSGRFIAFSSTEDLVPGQNLDGSLELFHYDASSDSIRQLTDATGGGSVYPSISDDGQRIFFMSNSNFGGSGFGMTRIYALDVPSGWMTPITSGDEESLAPFVSADGQQVVFQSRTDPTGENPDHQWEAFVATCPELGIASIPTLDPRSLVFLALALLLAGTVLLRR